MGRPRAFDPSTVLDQATEVFWRHGFRATSLDDLVAATGLNRPSLYGAFGDKAQLFETCLEHYENKWMGPLLTQAATEPTSLDALISIIRGLGSLQQSRTLPGGCLVVFTHAESRGLPPEMRERARRRHQTLTQLCEDLLSRARAEGILHPDTPMKGLAGMVVAQIYGNALIAREDPRQSHAATEALVATLGSWRQPNPASPSRSD